MSNDHPIEYLFKRALAVIIDFLILAAVGYVAIAVLNRTGAFYRLATHTLSDGTVHTQINHISRAHQLAIMIVGYYAMYVLYFTIGIARWNRSVGQAIMKLKVVGIDGGTISPQKALGRSMICLIYLLPYLSAIAYIASLFMIQKSAQRQALHDKLAKTRVIYA